MRHAVILTTILFVTCAAFAQSGNSEVFLYSVSRTESGLSLADGRNISNSPGYDNQPSFGYGDRSILFTSIRDDRSPDIYEYDLKAKTLERVTNSPESEYTPREKVPGQITFVREGEGQEMTVWKRDRKTGKEKRALKNSEPVAYYDFNAKGGALVWIRYAFMARYVDPAAGLNLYVSDNVLPSAPQQIPDSASFSFVYRRPDGSLWIKEFDPKTRAVRPIVRVNDEKIDYCWTPDQMILSGSGSKLFGFREGKGDGWSLIADLSADGLKEITRVAASGDGRSLAIVSN